MELHHENGAVNDRDGSPLDFIRIYTRREGMINIEAIYQVLAAKEDKPWKREKCSE